MTELSGIIYAYLSTPRLGELVSQRTSASLPFCGRYRLIDFALSSMTNAGVRNVGVIMQRDYQSLLDHLGSGKDWDLSRRHGGLRLLPPFGLPNSHSGAYEGNLEALQVVRSYIEDDPGELFILSRGDLVANLDLRTIAEHHVQQGLDITAVCTDKPLLGEQNRFLVDEAGLVTQVLGDMGGDQGVAGLCVYLISKSLLLDMLDWSAATGKLHFRDGMRWYLEHDRRIGAYIHQGYCAQITTVQEFYQASMDMLDSGKRESLFPRERPVRTKERAEVSTYYGVGSKVRNCMVADGCFIEGDLENCVLNRGVRVEKGAKLKNCVVMQDSVVAENAIFQYVISDKGVTVSPYTTLTGSPRLPLVIPKGSKL